MFHDFGPNWYLHAWLDECTPPGEHPTMALRVCPAKGCTNLTQGGRCTDCNRQADQARGTRQDRGYDAAHEHERAKWALILETRPVRCARCPELIHPGDPWDLGHTDDRTRWTGPEHPACNRAAGGRTARERAQTS